MIKREDLIKSKEYLIASIQQSLFEEVKKYLTEKGINKSDFAKQMGVSKGYVSQILSGDYDHKISKFIELSLEIGKIPIVSFQNIDSNVDHIYYPKNTETEVESKTDKFLKNFKFKEPTDKEDLVKKKSRRSKQTP